MGMSTSSTQLLFFIAAMVVASGLVGLFAEVVSSISDGVRIRGDDMYDTLMTDITVINDPRNIQNDPLTIYVKNTGKVKLASDVDVLIDNQPYLNNTLSVLSGTDWEPGSVLMVAIDVNLTAGEHTIKVVVSSGISDRFTFRI
jgi:flagellar protein FlaG